MSSESYKRNQVEEAIALTLNGPVGASNVPIKSRIKRLLDLDRRWGGQPAASDPEDAAFAFFGAEPPGSGVEVLFTAYEAFALLLGMKLMNHNLPQEAVVSLLRAARPDLERCHTRILSADPAQLFDPGLIEQRNRNGNYDATNSDPQFLLIVSDTKIRNANREAPYPQVFRGERDAFRFMLKEPGRSAIWFELVDPACELRTNLNHTKPSKRGRKG